MKKQVKIWGMMLVAAFALTNCTKENIQAPEVSEGTPFEIVASTVDTKTVNDGFSTDWVAGDQINIFHAITESTTYVSDGAFTITEDNLAASKFTGTLAGEFDPEEEYDWYALYPYSSFIKTPAAQTSGYSYIGGRSDQAQSQVGVNNMTHIAGSNYPIYGKAEAVPASDLPQLQMNHASALIEVKVTNGNEEDLNVTAISFKAPVSLVGTFYLNISDGISYTDGQYVSNIASLSVSDAVIKSGESASFYLAVKPFTATAGQELELTVNTQSKTVNLTQAQTFSAGKIKTLNFTYDKVETPGPADAVTATLDLTAAANRVAYSTEQQVWMQNGITLTNDKNASTTNVGNYIPARFYKSSDVTIEAPGNIYEIQINCAGLESKYVEPWSSIAGASLTGTIVTISLDGSAQSVTYNMSAQARANSVTVVYAGGGEANTPEIVVIEKNKTISAAGGVVSFAYTLNNLEGQTLNCSSDSEWLTAAVAEGNVNVTVAENDGVVRTGKITVTCGEAQPVVLTINQNALSDSGTQTLTVAQFLAASVGDTEYELTGVIEGTYNTDYGNFYLNDGTGKVLVYGLTATKQSSNDKSFASLGLRDGDTLTLIGKRADYNGTAQVGGPAYYVSHISAPFLNLVSESVFVAYDETTYSLEVASNTNWTATASEGVTLDKTSGNGNATVVMTFAANETSDNVTHTVTFTFGASTKVFTVTQATNKITDGPTEVIVEFSKLGYANAASVDGKTIAADENVSMVFKKGGASTAPAYYTSGSAIRMYQNGATLDVTAANGKTITKIVFTFSSNHYYIGANTGTLSAEASTRTWTGSATAVKFTSTGTDKDHRAYVSKMVITYE